MTNIKKLLLLLSLFSVQSLLSQEDNRSTDQVLQDVKKQLSSGSPSTDKLSTPIQFDASTENYQRFRNSPCFEQLGFVPGRDNETLYKSCEERLKQKTLEQAPSFTVPVLVGLTLLLFLGFWLFLKGFDKKNTS